MYNLLQCVVCPSYRQNIPYTISQIELYSPNIAMMLCNQYITAKSHYILLIFSAQFSWYSHVSHPFSHQFSWIPYDHLWSPWIRELQIPLAPPKSAKFPLDPLESYGFVPEARAEWVEFGALGRGLRQPPQWLRHRRLLLLLPGLELPLKSHWRRSDNEWYRVIVGDSGWYSQKFHWRSLGKLWWPQPTTETQWWL